MKRYISMILVALLLLSCMLAGAPEAHASGKKGESRAIAIVFDNSGSMYDQGDQAWCRATYAMEVFAAMLNAGDTLLIYPMHPITIDGKEYTMQSPFRLTDATQASAIRGIYTEDAGGTPIESIDCAVEGLQTMRADKKYMIVLTDGGTFSKNDSGLTKERTKKELDKRIQANAGKSMTVMYLGIGSSACMPTTEESEFFTKRQAVNSEDVLSTLTEMCNLVFGRDSLPKKHISGNDIDFDISMSKLIIFVQGENISNLKLTGNAVGTPIRKQQTKYSTAGSGDYKSVPDTSLQGMMVTYEDCAAGNYRIEYTGTPTSVEVYYEPDADLDFVFTGADGQNVDPNALYEGEYKVSFGMKDGKTGKLIASDLLGNPHYQGSYSVNGVKFPITYDGYSGEVPVSLKMNDAFDATLTVTYLSGYTITKDSTDFGWPEGGIQVAARSAGELKLEISGGDTAYSMQKLKEGEPYIAKVYYQGELLTGSALESVDLKWDPNTSNAEIKQEFAEDHYKLRLDYKDPENPQNTQSGECTVLIHAFYSAEGSSQAQTQAPLTYNINDDYSPVQLELYAPEDYIVIAELEKSLPIVAKLTSNGKALTAEEFAAVELLVDCGGIKYSATPNPQESSYDIKLLPTEGIAEGSYQIKATSVHTDRIGRQTQWEDSLLLTLSSIPLWLKWTIGLLLLLLLIIIIWLILHIRVMPNPINTTRKVSSMIFDGENVTNAANFSASAKKSQVKVQSKYGGRTVGLSMDAMPGKESYLYKPAKRRSAIVKTNSVKKFGPAKIQEAMIGSAKFVADENSGKLVPALPNQKPFPLTNGMMVKYSGTISDAGVDKDFEVTSKLIFKK